MEIDSSSLLKLAQDLDRLRDDLVRLSFALEDFGFLTDVEGRERAAEVAQDALSRASGDAKS